MTVLVWTRSAPVAPAGEDQRRKLDHGSASLMLGLPVGLWIHQGLVQLNALEHVEGVERLRKLGDPSGRLDRVVERGHRRRKQISVGQAHIAGEVGGVLTDQAKGTRKIKETCRAQRDSCRPTLSLGVSFLCP